MNIIKCCLYQILSLVDFENNFWIQIKRISCFEDKMALKSSLEPDLKLDESFVGNANIDDTAIDPVYEKSTHFQSLVRKIIQSLTNMNNNSNKARREFSKILKEARHER